MSVRSGSTLALLPIWLALGCGDAKPETPAAPAPEPAPVAEAPRTSPPVPARPVPAPALTRPTLGAQGGVCRVSQTTTVAENDQPARGIAVAYTHGVGVVVWPSDVGHVAAQRVQASGTPEGEIATHAILQARGVHALMTLGDRFVLMTRGACANPPNPGVLHCSSYLGLDHALAATAPAVDQSHSNQARVGAWIEVGGALSVALIMETGLDAAGLSAPTFDQEVQRLTFGATGGIEIAHMSFDVPMDDGGDPVTVALGPCEDGASACGVACAAYSFRCASIGLPSVTFRNPVIGSTPQSVSCDAGGCDAIFRRGPSVRAMRMGSARPQVVEVSAATSDAPLTGAVEAGRFTRRDPTGAVIGEPIAVASRDARVSSTWTGTHFLVAAASRSGRTTRYALSAIACDGATP